MTPYERLFWVGCGMGMVLTASCLLLPWVVLSEMQRRQERPSNVVRFRRRG